MLQKATYQKLIQLGQQGALVGGLDLQTLVLALDMVDVVDHHL
jgi:hypothetical protein